MVALPDTEFEDDMSLACAAFGTAMVDHVEARIAECEQVECPVTDHWFDGLYARETRVPAGAIFVTETHETHHPLFLMQGTISVWTKETGKITLSAPAMVKTAPGTRRIVFAHPGQDVVGITCHRTDETDPEVIRQQITSPRANPLLSNVNRRHFLPSVHSKFVDHTTPLSENASEG